MGWLKRVKAVLASEPETWLVYIYGQKFESLKYLQDAEPRYKGWYLRLSVWGYSLLRSIRLKPGSSPMQCEYLVFSGTINQKNSLETTLTELRKRKMNVCAIAPKTIINRWDIKSQNYEAMGYSPLEIFKCAFLCLLRAKRLRTQLKEKNGVLTRNRLDIFLNVYSDLVYFDTLLKKTKPKTVIVSNDHNTSNRALIALARNAGVKTVYMQHASVSKLFPALNVDYAFLDGESALETYRLCEENRPEGSMPIKNRAVFLTGQKKNLNTAPSKNKGSQSVGVALNALDSIEGVKILTQVLSENKMTVRLRWHPALSSQMIDKLKLNLRGFNVDFSDPKKESLGGFFSHIDCMVAGNSSIHLEAALSHVVPIHYEMNTKNIEDYYGYVKNGLSLNEESIEDLLETIQRIKRGELKINKRATKFYSSTFGTEWEGREGELVSETLLSLQKNLEPPVSAINL